MTELSYNENLEFKPFVKSNEFKQKFGKKFDLNFFFENEDKFENEFSEQVIRGAGAAFGGDARRYTGT